MGVAQSAKSSEQNSRATKDAIAAITRGDYSVIGRYLADEISHSFSRSGKNVDLKGRDDALQYGEEVGAVKIDIQDIFGSGDRVVVRFTADVPADSVQGSILKGSVKVSAIVIARFEGNKIVEVWHEQDTLGLLLANGYSVDPPSGSTAMH